MNNQNTQEITNTGRIGIYFLKDIWHYYNELKNSNQNAQAVEWKYINGVFNALGIGIEPTINFLMSASVSFEEFENWIEKNGRISKKIIDHFNSIILKEQSEDFVIKAEIFNESDLKQWNRDGFIVLRKAVSKSDCEEAVKFICEKIEVDIADPKTWYSSHTLRQGIMVQLFNSDILDKIRLSGKIKMAFEQLWKKNDLMVSMDRVSFNPPETATYQFPGPNLHWDISLKQPIPYGIQGLLYLRDTDKDQGAFTVIPGFHNKIDSWLEELDAGTNPREINLLDFFEENPIAGEAGDLIIWNQCLPHGSRPNTSTSPRMVQYINYQPLDLVYQNEWI